MRDYIREFVAALIQQQHVKTPDAYARYASAKVQQLLHCTQPPAATHFCPRCCHRTLRIVFTLSSNGQTMSVNLRCIGCGKPTVMHMRYTGSATPLWLKHSTAAP